MSVQQNVLTFQENPNQVVLKATWFSFLPYVNDNSVILDLGDRFNDVEIYVATPFTMGIFGQVPPAPNV